MSERYNRQKTVNNINYTSKQQHFHNNNTFKYKYNSSEKVSNKIQIKFLSAL